MSENVCKFCRAKCAESVFRDYLSAYYCGSWHDGAGRWSQGIACRDRCQEMLAQREATVEILKVQLESEIKLKQILRKRIAAAIAEAQKAWRFGLEHNRSIRCVLAADMDRVIEILEGKQ